MATAKKPLPEVDTSWMKEKMDIWISLPDAEKSGICYKRGAILKVDGQEVTIRNEAGSEEVVHASRVSAANSYKGLTDGFDDMVDMENLSEAELLYNLHEIYKVGKIFTYVGPTLIVLNPYCMIPELFTPDVLLRFQTTVRELRFDPKDLQPHVYALGAASMTNLIRDQRNQAIVISGESGAGKTENTKFAMKFLTSLNDVGGKKNADEVSIEDKILACNPVLEAFGNAKTVRNDNSSRFGKYVSLLVAKGSDQKILGATITNYLLEKSRVCIQSQGERNYHIFYHVFKGASMKELEALHLAKGGVSLMEKFDYLNKSGCYAVPTVNDQELYVEVTDSFRTMQFSQDEQKGVWNLVAATLWMGQLEFDDSVLTDKTPCGFKNEEPLKIVAELMQMDYAEISKAIRFKFREIQGQVIESPLNKNECIVTRDALAKEIYNRLFTWLVKRLNFTVMPAEMLVDGADIPALLNNYFHIGLLDIFGFEIFKFNSLEQLCINYTNEKLQQLYISYVFKNEEKVFIQEGLQDFLCELNFEDNQPVIDLLDAPPMGIFQMVDESCQVNTTDEALCQKIVKQHGTNPKLTVPKMAKMSFVVNHTASPVEYNTDGFRFKNRDELSAYIERAIFNSKFEIIPKIYKGLCGSQKEPEEATEKKGGKNDKFLGAKFRMQMKDLMTELFSCDCHFVRCIKPNDRKEKRLFLPYMTLQQIIYMGILDTIKVRKDSYPIRRQYRTFFERFGELSTRFSKKTFLDWDKENADFKMMSIDLLKEAAPELKSDVVLIGNTRLFMRIPAEVELNKKLEKKMRIKNQAAKRIQRMWMRYVWMTKWKFATGKILKILTVLRRSQNLFRVRKEYMRFQRIRASARKIGKWWRRLRAKWAMRKLRNAAIKIQSWWRSIFYKKKYHRKKVAAARINRVARGFIVRLRFQRKRKVERILDSIIEAGARIMVLKIQNKAALKIQTRWRGYIARKKNQDIIIKAKKAKETFLFNKNIGIIQRIGRGMIVRRAIKRLNAAAGFIQGFYRMKWYSSLYRNLRAATIIIQRNVLKWLYTKRIIESRNEAYFQEARMSIINQKTAETATLFGGIKSLSGQESLNKIKEVVPYSMKRINTFIKVIDVDLLTDLADVYDPSWSAHFLELQNDVCANSENQLQLIEVGETHTIAVSNNPRVYAWGWNDHFQLGRLPEAGEIACTVEGIEFSIDQFRPKQVAAGDEHNLLLDSNNNLFVWGSNRKGQLGLGHNDEINRVSNLTFTSNDRFTTVKAKGHNNLVVTESGAAYYWPLFKLSGDVITRPVLMNLPSKIQVQSGSCGYNFAILLTRGGLLYSFGIDNSAGQLGLGHYQPVEEPTLVEALKADGERVTQVSCGYKHVICKTSLGRAYTWGWGDKGQLGNNNFKNWCYPEQLDTSVFGVTKSKVTQVQAGYRHSLLMNENRRIYWMGTNGSLFKNARLVEVDLTNKIPDFTNTTDFPPLKLQTTWSRSISITYLTLGDTRTLEANTADKNKTISSMIQKIEEFSAHGDMDLPNVDHLTKFFSSKVIDKLGAKASTANNIPLTSRSRATNPASGSPTSRLKKSLASVKGGGELVQAKEIPVSHRRVVSSQFSEPNPVSYREKESPLSYRSAQKESPLSYRDTKKESPLSYRDLQKESPRVDAFSKNYSEFGSKNLTSSINFTPRLTNPSTDNQNMRNNLDWESKLKEIKKKFDKTLMIPKEQWSEKEIEFMKIASDPKVFKMLKNIS